MTIAQLEDRVLALEQKLNALAGRVEPSPANGVNSWIDEIHGTFQANAAYRQAARYGRAWRKGPRTGRSQPPKVASR